MKTNDTTGGTSADFLCLILFGMIILCIAAYIFDLIILSESLLYMIMYVWSRREPEAQMNIYGFKFQVRPIYFFKVIIIQLFIGN